MSDFFWLLSLAFLAFVFMLLKYFKVNYLNHTLLFVFFGYYIVFAYLGIIPLYYYWDKYRYFEGVVDRNIIFKIWLYSTITISIIIIAYGFLMKIFNFKFKNEKKTKSLSFYAKTFLTFLLIISIGVTIFYFVKLDNIPLLSAIRGSDASVLKVERSNATNNFQGNLHWFKIFYQTILTYISFVFFSIFLMKKNLLNFLIFAFLFLFTSFVTLSSTAKAPLITFLLGIFMTYILYRRVRIGYKTAISFGMILVTLIVIMYANFMRTTDAAVGELLLASISRIFTGQITPAYFYLLLFSDENLLLGKSLPNPGGIMPWDYYPLEVEVKNFMNPSLANDGIVGTAPTVFWAEAYVNFGFGGIIIASILIAVTLYTAQIVILSKLPYNPVTIGLIVFLSLDFAKLSLTGVSYFIFSLHRIVIIMLVIILLILNRDKSNTILLPTNNKQGRLT